MLLICLNLNHSNKRSVHDDITMAEILMSFQGTQLRSSTLTLHFIGNLLEIYLKHLIYWKYI